MSRGWRCHVTQGAQYGVKLLVHLERVDGLGVYHEATYLVDELHGASPEASPWTTDDLGRLDLWKEEAE